MDTDAVQELPELREQHGDLEPLLAEAALAKDALCEAARGNYGARRLTPRCRHACLNIGHLAAVGAQSCWARPIDVPAH
ncbi:hypothetical protein ACFWAY_47515 [Rhodococcus sp. NPDC059968]|uniref:hypothetical protein n=1 Tax=Rhodococcus sp. NPDC059968 TaxID=3347017 RepID=UPI00366F601F